MDLAGLIGLVAAGDQTAFARLYDHVAQPVYGLALRVVRDPAQAEEVAQEVLVDLWRTAPRFQAAKGSPMAWVMTLAHRRAVDRVRSAQAASGREERVARWEQASQTNHDEVAEEIETRMEGERVRRCLDSLSGAQREAVTLAYYNGHTYRQVAELLSIPLGTVKSRMRDGLLRMRDCLGVA